MFAYTWNPEIISMATSPIPIQIKYQPNLKEVLTNNIIIPIIKGIQIISPEDVPSPKPPTYT